MNIMHEKVEGDLRLRIMQYEDPENPKAWDNLFTMTCYHRRYDLGDGKAQNINDYGSWNEWFHGEVIGELTVNDFVFRPLYLYDHSGLSMSTSPYSCTWDSGQVGYIYALRSHLVKSTGYSAAELFDGKPDREPVVGERVELHGRDGLAQVESIS